ncbi:MAG: hypothetical protein RML73_06420 [Anaerolineae bacterium]|nr:hypothetical protein [Anaerolineae bacterium]
MPVLLLCYGEPRAKTLLKEAIEARYGLNPPALDSLKLEFEGSAPFKVAFVRSWVPVTSEAYFVFPTRLRWDFTVKPFGLPVQRGADAYDGETFRMVRGKASEAQDEAQALEAARRRLLLITAILLTPLSETFVQVHNADGLSFDATNAKFGDTVRLTLREDRTLASASVECFNHEAEKHQRLTFHLSPEQSPINGLMLPSEMTMTWDDEVFYKVRPIQAQPNAALDDALFRLEQDA